MNISFVNVYDTLLHAPFVKKDCLILIVDFFLNITV